MHERAEPIPSRLVSQDRDRDFEALLLETSTLAFRVAFAVLRHRQDAEDVAQEAFTKAYRSFWQLRDRARFRAWLVRTTWRAAIDRQKANRLRASREIGTDWIELKTVSDAAVASPARTERAAAVAAAIDALPDKLRLAIVLATIEGHDIREVAALLGVPEGTVKSRLFLARQRLKESLA